MVSVRCDTRLRVVPLTLSPQDLAQPFVPRGLFTISLVSLSERVVRILLKESTDRLFFFFSLGKNSLQHKRTGGVGGGGDTQAD